MTKMYSTPAKAAPPPQDRNSSDGLAGGTNAMIIAKMPAIMGKSECPGGLT